MESEWSRGRPIILERFCDLDGLRGALGDAITENTAKGANR